MVPVSQPRMTVSSKDVDSASIADSGRGTSIVSIQQASRHDRKNTHIGTESVADSGLGTSTFSDQDSVLNFIDSDKATSMKEHGIVVQEKEKVKVREVAIHVF